MFVTWFYAVLYATPCDYQTTKVALHVLVCHVRVRVQELRYPGMYWLVPGQGQVQVLVGTRFPQVRVKYWGAHRFDSRLRGGKEKTFFRTWQRYNYRVISHVPRAARTKLQISSAASMSIVYRHWTTFLMEVAKVNQIFLF